VLRRRVADGRGALDHDAPRTGPLGNRRVDDPGGGSDRFYERILVGRGIGDASGQLHHGEDALGQHPRLLHLLELCGRDGLGHAGRGAGVGPLGRADLGDHDEIVAAGSVSRGIQQRADRRLVVAKVVHLVEPGHAFRGAARDEHDRGVDRRGGARQHASHGGESIDRIGDSESANARDDLFGGGEVRGRTGDELALESDLRGHVHGLDATLALVTWVDTQVSGHRGLSFSVRPSRGMASEYPVRGYATRVPRPGNSPARPRGATSRPSA
jgi:hypothetical protein